MDTDSWLAELGEPERARARVLYEQLESAGAPDPWSLVRSEITGGVPQLAVFLFLQAAGNAIAGAVRDACRSEAAQRIQAAGVAQEDIARVALEAARSLAWDLCILVDGASAAHPDDVGWRLMEVGPNDELTGRDLGGLHESLSEFGPQRD